MPVAIASGTGIALVCLYLRTGVGPLLLMRRAVDRARAACMTAVLCWRAATEEWWRMWPAMLSRAQRER